MSGHEWIRPCHLVPRPPLLIQPYPQGPGVTPEDPPAALRPHLHLVPTQHLPGAVLLLGLAVHPDGICERGALHL